MSSPEQTFWRTIRPHLVKSGLYERVENPMVPGMPDVVYCLRGRGETGWLELKQLPAWPSGAETLVGPNLVREEQRAWWLAWAGAGARVWVLVRIGAGSERRHLLFPGDVAAAHLGRTNRSQLESHAAWGARAFNPLKLTYWLRRRGPATKGDLERVDQL